TYIPKVASAPTPPLPPSFLSLRIRPPHSRAAMAQMRPAVPSTYHSLLPSGTPPLLPIPLHVPSTSRRAEILEADTPPWKRLLLTAPKPGCEVGESSAAVARQPGPTMARSVDCSFVDTMETRFRDTERRMMIALEMVNIRVSYQVDVRSRESLEFYSRHHDSQKDRAAVRAEIEVLRRERLAYEQESIQTREALARSEAYSKALEAQVAVLETQARRHEWQHQTADDFSVQHIMRTQALEAGACIDTLEDTAILYSLLSITGNSRLKIAPKRTTRSTQVPPVTQASTATTTIVTEAQLQALIDRGVAAVMAEAEASRVRKGYDNNGSGPRLAQAVRVALTWWNSHAQTVTLEVAQTLPWKTLNKMMTDKVEKYIGGLPNTIHDSVKATRPKTMQEAIKFATELMDKRIRGVVENKRKFEGNSDRNIYIGSKPLCSKCDYHHEGPCPPRAETTMLKQGCMWLEMRGKIQKTLRKLVRIPFGNETLTIRGEGSNERNESRLNIISCSKAQEYMSKGCQVFLANITSTKDKDKSKGKRLEDVPVVREFPEIFLEDLPGGRGSCECYGGGGVTYGGKFGLNVNSVCYSNGGDDGYCWDFGILTMLVPGLLRTNCVSPKGVICFGKVHK
nr:reverse transcriptase domain-containing protein [Tanacetum cinerariifolium]